MASGKKVVKLKGWPRNGCDGYRMKAKNLITTKFCADSWDEATQIDLNCCYYHQPIPSQPFLGSLLSFHNFSILAILNRAAPFLKPGWLSVDTCTTKFNQCFARYFQPNRKFTDWYLLACKILEIINQYSPTISFSILTTDSKEWPTCTSNINWWEAYKPVHTLYSALIHSNISKEQYEKHFCNHPAISIMKRSSHN